MSSLIFGTDENQAIVATDTLAVLPDGKPFKYTTKTFILPHLKLIISGTGSAGFLSKWLVRINEVFIVPGIDSLDYHAPSDLAATWIRHKEELSADDGFTTTSVYHFGFSDRFEDYDQDEKSMYERLSGGA